MIKISSEYLDMRKIADSGQVFRFNKTDDGSYDLIANNKHLRIQKLIDNKDINTYELDCSEEDYNKIWKDYFDIDTDYSIYTDDLDENDVYLQKACEYSKGIRILRQDKWEMLISFIISQRKSIPAIKSSIEKMAVNLGEEIDDRIYAFPKPQEILSADDTVLETCGLGYRLPYIRAAARDVIENGVDLYDSDNLSDEELLEKLKEFKGVGVKVANCVLLFGYHRIGAFPIDVWVEKILNNHYDGTFPMERYKGYAGVLQQYMFFYEREKSNVKLK
jgi:8-oxoguanine DNA glycosylase